MGLDYTRYGRQIRLLEIGEAGQLRLEAAEVAPRCTGAARETEVTYLKRIGVKVDEREPEARRAPPPNHQELLAALGIRDSEPRALADGALQALEAMRTILGVE